MITRLKNIQENLCDRCLICFADCGGTPEFNEAEPLSDNVIACDAFHGEFNPETMIREAEDKDGRA